MTACLTVLYLASSDPGNFYRRYREEHIPLAEEILRPAGLVRWSIGRTLPVLDKGSRPCDLITNLYFDRQPTEVLEALSLPTGQRLAAHALSLTDGGMVSYLSRIEEATFRSNTTAQNPSGADEKWRR